jgi:hypothetical protein
MKVTVSLYAEGRINNYGVRFDINEPLVEAFKPLKTTDDPCVALATGEVHPQSEIAIRVIKLREDFAAELAEVLTKQLVNIMKKDDTYNGYLRKEINK